MEGLDHSGGEDDFTILVVGGRLRTPRSIDSGSNSVPLD
jgi:hypothetical protein